MRYSEFLNSIICIFSLLGTNVLIERNSSATSEILNKDIIKIIIIVLREKLDLSATEMKSGKYARQKNSIFDSLFSMHSISYPCAL